MAVPDNFNFSLQDVVNEIGCSADMLSCINNAIAGGYDPTWAGEVGLRKFRNYQHIYLNLDQYVLYFDFEGNACSTNVVNVTSNIDWYVVVETSEITGASCYPSSGSGNGSVTFFCNEINYDGYIHASQMTFYRTSDDSYLNSCAVLENPYGQSCY